MRMLIRVFIFTCLLHLASGLRITSIQTMSHTLKPKEGSRLFIPCLFQLDKALWNHQIQLEWGMNTEYGGAYRALLRFSDTEALPVENPNPRAWLNPEDVTNGDCSMELDPVRPEDSGTYRLRLAIDGEEYKHVTKVEVQVTANDVFDTETPPPGVVTGMPSTDSPWINFINTVSKVMKNNHSLLFQIIQVTVIVLLILLIPGPVIYFAIQYFRLKRKIKDNTVRMEEGGL